MWHAEIYIKKTLCPLESKWSFYIIFSGYVTGDNFGLKMVSDCGLSPALIDIIKKKNLTSCSIPRYLLCQLLSRPDPIVVLFGEISLLFKQRQNKTIFKLTLHWWWMVMLLWQSCWLLMVLLWQSCWWCCYVSCWCWWYDGHADSAAMTAMLVML